MDAHIRVLLVDDHVVVRNGIRMLLETDERIIVSGEAGNGLEALKLIDEFEPDVVLMDLRMPEMDGMTAIRRIRKTHPSVAIIILTTFNEDELMLEGLAAGARGYLLKDMTRDALLNTVVAASQGDTLLSSDILNRVLMLRSQSVASAASVTGTLLSDREIEVLRAVASGHTSRSAGEELGITERTVKAHLTSIFNKLGVDTRAAAVAAAAGYGWL